MKDRPELTCTAIFGIKQENPEEKTKNAEVSSNIRNDPQYKATIGRIDIEVDTCPLIEDILLTKRPNIF